MIQARPIASQAEWLLWRRSDVTASDVGALFGLHPYKTLLELWAEKSGVVLAERAETAAMRRGKIMEPSVAAAVAIERPTWRIEPVRIYFRDIGAQIGATPDFRIMTRERRRRSKWLPGVLQAKTVAPREFAANWSPESPPFWIVLQTVTEMMLTGWQWGAVAALIVDAYRFDVAIYEVERNEAAETRIRSAVREFWRSVDSGEQPKADFERDSALLSAMYPQERPGPELDLTGDNRVPELLAARREHVAALADHEAKKAAIDAELKAKLGFAEAALGQDFRITWKTVHYKASFRPDRDVRVLRVTDKNKTERLDDGEKASGGADHVNF